MSTASGFMISLGQCLSTMALYSAGHPARECVIDASFARLVDLLADIQYADYSIIGDSVVFQGRVIDELRSWDWATRLSTAGIERLEIDADVTRDGWVQALEEMYAQLDGAAAPSNERRQLVATAIRFGSLRVMGGQGDAVAQAEK
jgi:hypothetical protein